MKLVFLLFAVFIAGTFSSDFKANILTKSTAAKGVLLCGKQPAKDVHVRLYRNNTQSNDDILAYGKTNELGEFALEGHTAGRPADEIGLVPTLRFYHNCGEDPAKAKGLRKFSFVFDGLYTTLGRVPRRTFDIGRLNLELGMPGETREKTFEEVQPKIFT